MIKWSYIEVLSFVLSFIISYFSIPIFKKLAFKFDIIDKPNFRKIHKNPTPYLGGAGIYISFWSTLFLGYISILFINFYSTLLDYRTFSLLTNTLFLLKPVWIIFITSTVIFIIGLVDDKYNLSPYMKLFFEVIAGILLFLGDIKITVFIPYKIAHLILTVMWVIFITNAFNLLDNMNGLSSGVGIICSFFLFVISIITGQYLIALLLLVFMASIFGFWIHNFFYGSIFMGDAGSLFIGFLLSVISILETFKIENAYPYLPIFLPLIIFSVPIYDTLSVIIIRLKRGTSIFKADRNHFSHRLVNLGFSKKGAVLFIYLFCILSGISSLFLTYSKSWWQNLLVFVQILIFFTIIAILEKLGYKNEK